MAITYSSQGAGVSTATSGATLQPACPATVNPGDIFVAHVAWNNTSDAPSTPGGWTLLDGPRNIGTTPHGRHWIFGKIADGSEDGAAISFGTAGGTTKRWGRIYSFIGRVSGSVIGLVRGFAATSHATDPQMPTVTTTRTGALAIACVAQNDDNTVASATGESGGNWVEAVAEYTATTGTGVMMQIQTATPTGDPGTISGGSAATANDPCGVIGFEVRPDNIEGTDGSAAGLVTSAIVGVMLWAVVIASSGLTTVTGDGEAGTSGADGASVGTSTVSGISGAIAKADATSSGVASDSIVSGATAGVVAASAGAASDSTVGAAIAVAVGEVTVDSTAPAPSTVLVGSKLARRITDAFYINL